MPFYLKTSSTATAPSLFPSHSILCSMNDLLQLFIFAQTPLEELRAWLAATPHRFARFAPGERIIAQGAECRSALLLTAGKANTEMVQDGRDLSIDVLKAPMLLASAWVCSGRRSRACCRTWWPKGGWRNETGLSWPWSSRAAKCEPAPRRRLLRLPTQAPGDAPHGREALPADGGAQPSPCAERLHTRRPTPPCLER